MYKANVRRKTKNNRKSTAGRRIQIVEKSDSCNCVSTISRLAERRRMKNIQH